MSTQEQINQMAEDGSSRPPIKSTASGSNSLAGLKLSTRLVIVLGVLALVCLIPMLPHSRRMSASGTFHFLFVPRIKSK